MKDYRCTIYTMNGKKVGIPVSHTVLDFCERPYLSRNDFKIIIGELFYLAAQGIQHEFLRARITNESNEEIFEVRCLTHQNGSAVRSKMQIGIPGKRYETVRIMTIAD